MEQSLAGKVALVTGAGKRIGRSIALRLAADGADVVVNYLTSQEEAESVAAEIRSMGRKSSVIQADVTQRKEVQSMFAAIEAQFGRLDIMVNNAGMFFHAEFEELTEEQWDRILDVNLKSQMLCAQAAVPLMRRGGGGHIINISSLGGLLAWPGYTHYCVSKAGVIMLTRCLARALGPDILVNSVAPGTIEFPGDPPNQGYVSENESLNARENARLGAEGNVLGRTQENEPENAQRRVDEDAPENALERAEKFARAHVEDYIRRIPLHRTGTGDDIADTVAFLAQSKFITGQIIPVDGGRTLV